MGHTVLHSLNNFLVLKLWQCRVLTMERLHGAPLTDLAAIRRVTAQDPERILINALNTWFGSVLACPSFHADVHAGETLSRCAFLSARLTLIVRSVLAFPRCHAGVHASNFSPSQRMLVNA